MLRRQIFIILKKYFALLLDSKPDVSQIDQMTVIINTSKKDEIVEVKESFIDSI